MHKYRHVVIIFICFILTVSCKQKKEIAKDFPLYIELYSPKSNLSLELENGRFSLARLEFTLHNNIYEIDITHGAYLIEGNYLKLKGVNGKTYTLKIESHEILQPIRFDTLTASQKFLAWTIYHKKDIIKQTGGWTDNNEKDGEWMFYDESGKLINMKLYDKGKLVDDDFKYR